MSASERKADIAASEAETTGSSVILQLLLNSDAHRALDFVSLFVLERRDKNGWVTGLDEGGHRGHGVVVPSDDPGELLVR
jgi:hypothetical protein